MSPSKQDQHPGFHMHSPQVEVREGAEDLSYYNKKIMEIYSRAIGVFPDVLLDSGGHFVLSRAQHRDLGVPHQLADFNTEMLLTLEAAHTAVLRKANSERRGDLNEEFKRKDRASIIQFLKDNLPEFPTQLFKGYEERAQKEVEEEDDGTWEEND